MHRWYKVEESDAYTFVPCCLSIECIICGAKAIFGGKFRNVGYNLAKWIETHRKECADIKQRGYNLAKWIENSP